MKKVLAVALVLCLLAPCAMAEITDKDIEDFAVYVSVLGLPDLWVKNGDIRDLDGGETAISWNVDNCRVILSFDAFHRISKCLIQGEGDSFLVLSASFIMSIDHDHMESNLGAFTLCYLMARVLDHKNMGSFSNYMLFTVTKDESGMFEFFSVR
jgi:hypothetical protein